MKVRRKQNKKLKNKGRKEQPKHYKRWLARPQKYSRFPYLITVSEFRRNIFLTAADFQGHIKFWTNAGRAGFKGRNKTEAVAITSLTKTFFKKVWDYGIRTVFLKFKHCKRAHHAVKKALRTNRFTHKNFLKLLGVWTELNLSFNGCRRKKLRRKKRRRRARKTIIQTFGKQLKKNKSSKVLAKSDLKLRSKIRLKPNKNNKPKLIAIPNKRWKAKNIKPFIKKFNE